LSISDSVAQVRITLPDLGVAVKEESSITVAGAVVVVVDCGIVVVVASQLPKQLEYVSKQEK
jgi:uncharacterized protein with von Willebrand factor type A (vWA) domain